MRLGNQHNIENIFIHFNRLILHLTICFVIALNTIIDFIQIRNI